MYTILVLEDDTELSQTICHYLEKEGYRALAAYTCKEGKSLAQDLHFCNRTGNIYGDQHSRHGQRNRVGEAGRGI